MIWRVWMMAPLATTFWFKNLVFGRSTALRSTALLVKRSAFPSGQHTALGGFKQMKAGHNLLNLIVCQVLVSFHYFRTQPWVPFMQLVVWKGPCPEAVEFRQEVFCQGFGFFFFAWHFILFGLTRCFVFLSLKDYKKSKSVYSVNVWPFDYLVFRVSPYMTLCL